MKNVLLVFPDYSLPQHVLDFSLEIAKKHTAILYGLFINSLKPINAENYLFPNDIDAIHSDFTKEPDKQELERLEKSLITIFENRCKAMEVPFEIKKIHQNHFDTLTDASEFADLIIMHEKTDPATFSIKSFLKNVRCPVVLLPETLKEIESLIFAFEDHFPGMHAIKMFTYLFPIYKKIPARFVSVVPHNVISIEYKEEINTWLKSHYSDVKIEILRGDVKDILPTYINQHHNAIVIMGAFGRSGLSLVFKESLGNLIIEKTKAALFIAHD